MTIQRKGYTLNLYDSLWNSVNFHWFSETFTDSNLECIKNTTHDSDVIIIVLNFWYTLICDIPPIFPVPKRKVITGFPKHEKKESLEVDNDKLSLSRPPRISEELTSGELRSPISFCKNTGHKPYATTYSAAPQQKVWLFTNKKKKTVGIKIIKK